MLLSSLQTRLTEKNRELHQTLQAEQDSLVKTKAYLRQQQETLKQRRVALKRAHKDWSGDTAKSSKTIGTAVVSVVALCMACNLPIVHSREIVCDNLFVEEVCSSMVTCCRNHISGGNLRLIMVLSWLYWGITGSRFPSNGKGVLEG